MNTPSILTGYNSFRFLFGWSWHRKKVETILLFSPRTMNVPVIDKTVWNYVHQSLGKSIEHSISVTFTRDQETADFLNTQAHSTVTTNLLDTFTQSESILVILIIISRFPQIFFVNGGDKILQKCFKLTDSDEYNCCLYVPHLFSYL